MVELIELDINLDSCKKGLQEFQALLDSKDWFGEDVLVNFFRERPHLILLMGKLGLGESSYYQSEFNFFNEFRADFGVCNKSKDAYVFVEFEEATEYCIFKRASKSPKVRKYQWASKFEHGYSQIIDWFYRLDDFAFTKKFSEHFCVKEIEYSGYLVIGRQKSIPNYGYRERLDWRSKKVMVNGRSVICMTYDELLIELRQKIDEWDLPETDALS